jgi:hypothetical protein
MRAYLSHRREREPVAPMLGKRRLPLEYGQAINKVNRHRNQPAPSLKSKMVIVMNGLNGRRAKGGRNAKVQLSLLSPHR